MTKLISLWEESSMSGMEDNDTLLHVYVTYILDTKT